MSILLILLIGSLSTENQNSTEKGTLYLRAHKYKDAIPFLTNEFQLAWAYENLAEFDKAISHYKKSHPLLKCHATYRIAHCLKELEKYEKAIDYYEDLVNEFPDFVFINWAMRELGWCYEKIGDYDNALDVWDYEFEPPFSWYKIAKLYNKIGKNSVPLWIQIASEFPNSEYAIDAISKLPKDSILLIGEVYYLAGQYESAVSSLEAVEGGEKILALSLYELARYEKALTLSNQQNLWCLAGKCSQKLGNLHNALMYYSKSENPEAIYLKARLLEEIGKPEKAILSYIRVPKDSPFFEFSNFRAGMLAFDLKHLDLAYRTFRNVPPPISYYWCYRILSLQGDGWKANLYKKKLLKEYPLSYYAWILGASNGIIPIPPENWLASHSSCPISPEENEKFERGKLLVELGITEYGNAEFRSLPNNPLLLWKIAKFFHNQGLNWLAIPYASHIKSKGGIPKEIAKVLYPLSFLPTIEEASQQHGIDKFLMLALIRDESHFKPDAVSYSNAIGLAQIIPQTGKRIAKQLGVKEYNLFDPSTNIGFGAFYLSQCLEEFNGSLQLALAAYNGGPHGVREWIAERDTSRMDEWVEWIPFKQTRRYVRKVIRSYFAYKMLYTDMTHRSH